MLSKEGAPFKEHRGGPPFSNRKSWNLSIESHEVFRMKIKEKSKVDFNSIRFSFQIHARYRRVDTGSSVYKKIFTPGTITFYCAHRMSVPRQIKVIAKIKLRGFIFPWASFWNALKVVDCCLSINPEAWWEHRPNHKQTILNKKTDMLTKCSSGSLWPFPSPKKSIFPRPQKRYIKKLSISGLILERKRN